ncbi:MAG: hypothetical protein HY749_08085 [Gammaproteobacteria bacterium]|nr:hypothetical protein [Gammaproteobacteria bacterium]MBI5619305.1 hypothetical protein [Gammaproteobacteria bacterium]
MRRAPVLIALLASLPSAARAAGELALAPPAFLVGPHVAHSALGATYAYRGRAPHAASALQITVVEVPDELAAGGRTSERCLKMFVDELARGRNAFFSAPIPEPLVAAGLSFAQVRWLDTAASGATGVMGCAVDGERYVAVSYQDSLKSAVESFPKIRAALAKLAVPR